VSRVVAANAYAAHLRAHVVRDEIAASREVSFFPFPPLSFSSPFPSFLLHATVSDPAAFVAGRDLFRNTEQPARRRAAARAIVRVSWWFPFLPFSFSFSFSSAIAGELDHETSTPTPTRSSRNLPPCFSVKSPHDGPLFFLFSHLLMLFLALVEFIEDIRQIFRGNPSFPPPLSSPPPLPPWERHRR